MTKIIERYMEKQVLTDNSFVFEACAGSGRVTSNVLVRFFKRENIFSLEIKPESAKILEDLGVSVINNEL